MLHSGKHDPVPTFLKWDIFAVQRFYMHLESIVNNMWLYEVCKLLRHVFIDILHSFFLNWGFICLFLDLRANLLRIIPSLTRLSGFSQA